MVEKKLNDLFYDTLKDIYFAERQILKSLPKMAKAAKSASAREASACSKAASSSSYSLGSGSPRKRMRNQARSMSAMCRTMPSSDRFEGGTDASAVAHALAQKGDLTVWQYNVHRGPNGELQQAPTAKIGLLANSSLRVEPYSTPYAILPHQ